MKKGEFTLSSYLITFLIVCGILVTFGTMAVKMGNDYAPLRTTAVNSSFSSTYNKLDTIVSISEEQTSKIKQTDIGTANDANTLYSNALATSKMILPSISIFNSMINDAATMIGVPPIWITIAGTIMFILISFAIIYLIFGRSA